jgi:hypothetical protein
MGSLLSGPRGRRNVSVMPQWLAVPGSSSGSVHW